MNLRQMVSDWGKLINGTKELVSLLEEEKIYDYERLPTETVLAPLSAIFAIMPDEPDIKGKLRAIKNTYGERFSQKDMIVPFLPVYFKIIGQLKDLLMVKEKKKKYRFLMKNNIHFPIRNY